MSNLIDLNENHFVDIYRVAYNWGNGNKLDTYYYDYKKAKEDLINMKQMCKNMNMFFELVVFEKFEIRSKDLSNEIK